MIKIKSHSVDYLNIPYGPLMLEWRLVVGFEKNYIVSNYGDVIAKERLATAMYNYKTGLKKSKSIPIKERKLNPSKSKGYFVCNLSDGFNKKRMLLHRIMAIAFIPNPLNKPFINHKNCVRDDKFISNLEWCTPKENNEHAIQNSAAYKNRDLKIERKRKLTKEQYFEILDFIKFGYEQMYIASLYPISHQTVSLIKLRQDCYSKLYNSESTI